MIKVKQYFINLHWKSDFDAKTGECVSQDISVHMTLIVERINIRLNPNKNTNIPLNTNLSCGSVIGKATSKIYQT